MTESKNAYSLCEFKEKHPDTIVLLRCGDFYELRDSDAETGNRVLNLCISHHTINQQLYCAFPHHALDMYLPKLVRAGCKVAIIDGDIK